MAGWRDSDGPEVDEHRFSYRGESDDDIIAEYDEQEAGNMVLGTLIREGHPVLRLFVDGKKSLGSYGDYGRAR